MYRKLRIFMVFGILGTAIYFLITDPEFFSKYTRFLIGGAVVELVLIASLFSDYIDWSNSIKSRNKGDEARRETMMYRKR
ncbi:MAG: hypothetical protein ACYS8W_07545 [Planctomycetota bacterium]|jgi:hypothetical protein